MRASIFSIVFTVVASMPFARTAHGQASPNFDSGAVKTTVTEVAATISREYMDAGVGERVAGFLLRRLNEGAYDGLTAPEALAVRLTGDLLAESRDKHLAVTLIRQPAPGSQAPATRAENVRRTNGGVQRVEILSGNVGYLKLTSFWRLDEGRDAIENAMRLLRRADALIVDMRQNTGGSPETVALVAGYLFDEAGLPLFEIVSRSGERVAYATPVPGPPERDGRRPVYVLTAPRTFSAGEGFAFLLQERGRAEVIGARTPGAANPGRSHRVNAWLEVTVPNGKVVSAVKGANWDGVGVVPDIDASDADALALAHARALKRLNREPI